MEKQTPEKIVEYAKTCLAELQKLTRTLFETTAPELQQDERLRKPIEDFHQALEQLSNNLKNPTFRIITVGTTSSGKSTAVNALIGRRLAPIESQEMSAGTLTFIHHQDGTRFTIEDAPHSEELWKRTFSDPSEAKWKLGTETNLSDEQIYDKLRATKGEKEYGYDGVMAAYHQLKKECSSLIAPAVRVEVPLLPMLCPELLQLPTRTHFELIDLPGLKSVSDAGNLAVIQEQLKQAFSLVILDYNQTDENNRKKLLGELKEIVDVLGGRTDTMLFVLNKIDSRTENDKSLDSVLNILGEEIAKVLGLENPPEIVKTSLLVLSYAQCAWGPSPSALPQVAPVRKKLIKSIPRDCLKLIWSSRGDPAFKKWYGKHEDDCTEGKLNDDDLRYLLTWAKQVSGGQILWDRLRQRIAERFPELVIFPLVCPVVKDVGKPLVDLVIEEAKIREKATIDKVKEQKTQLDQQFSKVQKTLEERIADFGNKLHEALNLLASADKVKENLEKAQELLGKPKGFGILEQIHGIIRKDVQFRLTDPMREAMKNGTKGYEFIELVRDAVAPDLRPRLGEAYAELTKFIKPQDVGGRIIWDWGGFINVKDPPQEVREASRKLMVVMCEAIARRAEWTLQVQLSELNVGLDSILNKLKDNLIEIAAENLEKEHIDLLRAESSLSSSSKSAKLSLPKPFMECPMGYKERTLLGIPYWFDKLLGPQEMAIELLKKVDSANSEKLWPVITTHLTEGFNRLTEELKTAVKKAKSFLDQGLSKQIEWLEAGKEVDLQKWKSVQEQCQSIKDALVALEQAARSPDKLIKVGAGSSNPRSPDEQEENE
ncbi:MAG: hypothetical protein BWK78_04790 [Thiotrichaceae bacterium IS1]|nr:MAG: hypothetical protein BWK78_04790 [Thiotrichaceae bacterium IS1]